MEKNERPVEQTAIARGNVKQVAGDNHETTTTNANIFIGIFIVLAIALGGLAWAFTAGLNQGGQAPQTEQGSETE